MNMMKKIINCIVLIFSVSLVFSDNAKKDNWPTLKGPYLGRELPGSIPELFSRNINARIEIKGIPIFVKNGNLLIFKGTSSSVDGVFIMEQKKGVWERPHKILSLSQYHDRHFYPTLDHKSIFFTSKRPTHKEKKESENPNIWVMEKITSAWSQPQPLTTVNSIQPEFYSTVTKAGTLYFTRCSGEWKCDIFRARLKNGKYTKVENIGKSINTEYVDGDPYIAPDESYMIFLSNRPEGLGQHDFYISYLLKNSSWTKPKHLGKDINSKANDVCPLVTHDGRLFFFGSNRSGKYEIYWMDTSFIDRFRPD